MGMSLRIVEGVHRGRRIPLSRKAILIGRHETCHIRPETRGVSRKHCEIVEETDGVLVRDLNSTNGTVVNGEKLHGVTRRLKKGDRIEVGPLAFVLEAAAAATTADAIDAAQKEGSSSVSDVALRWFAQQASLPRHSGNLDAEEAPDTLNDIAFARERAGSRGRDIRDTALANEASSIVRRITQFVKRSKYRKHLDK